jgi:putative glutamine amidotransferase
LVLSGGSDIDPAWYDASPDPAAGPFYSERDGAELDLCRHALATGMPLLGICRGLQVINVALGGTLHQHLPDLVGSDCHSPEENGYGSHKVSVAAATRVAAILGRSEAAVPTHHHQAIDSLGGGLVATAWTDDGVIEAVEFDHALPAKDTGPFMIGVQWHPEAGDDLSLFTALVAAASEKAR